MRYHRNPHANYIVVPKSHSEHIDHSIIHNNIISQYILSPDRAHIVSQHPEFQIIAAGGSPAVDRGPHRRCHRAGLRATIWQHVTLGQASSQGWQDRGGVGGLAISAKEVSYFCLPVRSTAEYRFVFRFVTRQRFVKHTRCGGLVDFVRSVLTMSPRKDYGRG